MYASLQAAAAWAEWRAATGGAIDAQSERRRLWRIDVRDLSVLDLRREDVTAALGIARDQLRGPREAAQPVAARARALGAEGMIVPSAAAPESWNLVVFPEGFTKLSVAGSRSMHPEPPA